MAYQHPPEHHRYAQQYKDNFVINLLNNAGKILDRKRGGGYEAWGDNILGGLDNMVDQMRKSKGTYYKHNSDEPAVHTEPGLFEKS